MEKERRILITIVYPPPPSMPNRPNRVTSLPPTLRFHDVHSPARSIAGQEPLIDDETDTHIDADGKMERRRSSLEKLVSPFFLPSLSLSFPFFFFSHTNGGKKEIRSLFLERAESGTNSRCKLFPRTGRQRNERVVVRAFVVVVDDNNGVRIRAYVPR